MNSELNFKIAEILRRKINEGIYVSYTGLGDSELTEEFFSISDVKEYVLTVSEGSCKAKRIEMVKSYGAEPLLFDDNNRIIGINENAFYKWVDGISCRNYERNK